jgi:glutamate/tyrosine decarboxylase-like PLP-dependent enzyme
MGLRPHQLRVLPTDDRWRLQPEAVTAAIRADHRAGRLPFAVCASAGSTNTGAVDPLAGLADVCATEELRLDVDAAYSGFAALTPKGRALLAGIERADSATLDPHKWLFQPLECGAVLVRDYEAERVDRAVTAFTRSGRLVSPTLHWSRSHQAAGWAGCWQSTLGLPSSRTSRGVSSAFPPTSPEPRRSSTSGAALAGGSGQLLGGLEGEPTPVVSFTPDLGRHWR